MKVIQLISENIKALKAVSITPKGDTVVISGRNAQGKTSVLDSIEYALGGKDSICEEPIRKGQQKARIICDLGDLVVERSFSTTSGDSILRVKTKDGKPVKSPQAMLDELCSHVAFDPLSFVRMKPGEQVATLSNLVGVDLTESNAKRKAAYDERTLAGRELAAAKTRLATFQFFPDASDVEASVSDLMSKLTAAQAHNRDVNLQTSSQSNRANQIKALEMQVASINTDIAELEKQIVKKRQQQDSLREQQQDILKIYHEKEPIIAGLKLMDEAPIRCEIENTTLTNTKVQANRRHTEQNAEVQKHQFTVDKLTAEIEAIDQDKQDRLTWAEFPLEGLSFDDSRVLLNGVPFSQCSQAQQLQAAVAIGLALNPKVRVILIRDASLLDDDSMRLVGELAVKHDAQIWMEVVNSKDPSAVVIEDGEVKP